MKLNAILSFAVKKKDPERAALEECARIAKKARNHVWEGATLPPRTNVVGRLLRLLP